MTEMEYIKQLEERVERLEKFISKIIIGEGQNISFNDCTLCDIYVSEECNLSFNDCPIGTVIPKDIDDAEDRIDDLEDKLNNILEQIDDVENKLQIADVFLLPSKFEGLSIAAIEAQASGLPCIISTNVDVKTKINKNVRLIDKNNKQKWVDEIFNALKEQRYCSQDEIIAAGYDIKTEAIKLDKFYKNKIIKLRNSR